MTGRVGPGRTPAAVAWVVRPAVVRPTALDGRPAACGYLGPRADPECALDALVAAGRLRPGRLSALRRVLVALRPEWQAPPVGQEEP